MSWWKSSNLTSFASQALKTAQKSIDKVLDISEDGREPSSSVSSEEKAESPKSPPPTKPDSDGDNFWSAWLGDSGSQAKDKTRSEEKETESITQLFTSSFKSERAKSKVEEAILSSSGKSQKAETKSETVEMPSAAAESCESSKKGSPLKLTNKLSKKKPEVKKGSEAKASVRGTTSSDEKSGSATEGAISTASSASLALATDTPDQITKHEDMGGTSITKLAITDMVSSVSDGWTVEGWAADGQLEDLLQTSMIQKMEEEEGRESDVGSGMTRSLSSSSAVTVQDLAPSLVVADSETAGPALELSKCDDTKGHNPVVETLEETMSITKEASSSDDVVKHGTEESQDVSLESTVPDVVAEKIDDCVTVEVSANAGSSVWTDADSAAVKTDEGAAGTDEDDISQTITAAVVEAFSSAPQDSIEGIPESVDAISEAVMGESDVQSKDEAGVTENVQSETECAPENTDEDQTIIKETLDVIETLANEERKDNADSEKLTEDHLEESQSDTKESGDSELVTDTNQLIVEGDQSVGDPGAESSSAEMKKIPSGPELENSEKGLLGNDQEKKASEWVVEMCQLKDSIASTTASDELSDSNRTITSEDVGELSVDVGDAVAENKESEGGSDGQQEQMTLKVAATNEMVSSTVSSSSSLVKNLEEAMTESVKDNDSHSTTSTEKSSEMVRIESGHNSGHTSGDEIETTTSSDIEIISTPNSNGEYRLERPFEFSPLRYALSRTVRHSPPGHKRSDSSSSGHSNWSKNGDEMLSPEGGSHALEEHWPMVKEEEDSSGDPIETGKLLQKLADMAEVLEAREKKLMELSRESIDLQEANNILRQQLQQSEEAREVEMSDLTTLTEEFTKRLSEAEKKFNNLARERDSLKRQLKDTETILARRSDNSAAVEKLMKEKDLQITELLAEGEKLSKQQLQSNNIIKKLRNKEKENEALIKSQNQKIESEGAELEHLRKVLDVKEDLEKKQIEAINQLNNLVKKQEAEIQKLKSEAEDHQEKIRSMQVTLDNSYKEIAELHKKSATKASEAQEARLSVELAAKEELRLSLERHQQQARQENEALISQIEDLRLSLTRMEKEHSRKEDILRQEISDLQQRLQDGEDRNQELTQGVSAATRPLLRQIENLQSTYAAQSSSFEKIERNLTERLSEAQAQLASAQEKERSASEKFLDISTRIKGLESQVSILRQEKSTLSAQLEMERAKVEALEDSRHSDITQLEASKSALEKQLSEFKKQQVLLENQLEMEKMKVESEKKRVQLAHESIKEKELELQLQQSLRASPAEVSLMTRSSHASLSRESSFSENMTHSLVLPDDSMEKSFMMVSPNGNKMSLYETLRQTGASTLIENLQSQLKLREGEISQLQSDITELEKTREAMARELVNVSNENASLESQVQELGELKTKFTELDNRYNALLMMYGEKVEEAEELALDLQDVKDMYKAQIEELVNRR